MDIGTGKEVIARLPTWCYEADVKEDIILSYGWCHSRGMEVVAPEHGLRCRQDGRVLWIPGSSENTPREWSRVFRILNEQPWALSIGVGHGEVVDALRSLNYRVLSIDPNPASQEDIRGPIEAWEYQTFPQGSFEAVYARLYTVGEQLQHLQKRVQTLLTLVEYLQPKVWVLQVPRGSEVVAEVCLRDIPYVDCDYCQFGSTMLGPYRFFGAQTLFLSDRRCSPQGCPEFSEPPKPGTTPL